jgi:hypothetical protein
MATRQHIDWTVSASDAVVSPLGYRVELADTRDAGVVLATHRSSDGAGNFQLWMPEEGMFVEYPPEGLSGAKGRTVRFLPNGEAPLATLAVAAGSSVYRMPLDCSSVIQEKQVCADGAFRIESVSRDRDGNVWAKDSSGTVTVTDRYLRVVSTIRLDPETVFVAADPLRMVFWQVLPGSIRMVKMGDLSVSLDLSLPQPVAAVMSHDFSEPSGSLFMVTSDGGTNTSVAVTPLGVVTNVGVSAISTCQWGSKGALFSDETLTTIYVFDGTSVTGSFSTIPLGLSAPARIASTGNESVFLVGGDGVLRKANSSWGLEWSLAVTGLGAQVDVRVTPEEGLTGRVTYMFSTSGVASVRDMLDSGSLYGIKLVDLPAGRSPSLVPAAAVMSGSQSSHVWARITPARVD